MKCISKGNGILQLENGEVILFLKWINSIKGKEYFLANDKEDRQRIYHVSVRNENKKITEIEAVK